MEDDDGNIEFVGSNRANDNGDQRGENGRLERRKDREMKRLSREEGGKIYEESSIERRKERRRRRSSEKEANGDSKSDVKRKEGLFPPSVDIR